ncbi:MAG: addiction module antidote protein HigA family [Pseudomonadota bacterium]|jgi:addiction module HigA family antidote
MLPAKDALHPGLRIKAEVIPTGMSVTQAAKLIGVGRPALSNLLNGKAALSAEMATRLEKAFQYPLKDLMEMQARYESALAEQKEAPADTKAYVPPFLAIKANNIEAWVLPNNIQARTRFAVFLRTLVHSTGRGLIKVDFPGNDDAERPGWDGFVETAEGTPWIPFGRSGWEFGTNKDPKTKADGDFDKSVKAYNENGREREEMTFVFVTPRRWAGKAAWIAAKTALKLWKDVRAYDASDLEQWLEQSLSGQAWFANETHIPAQHVRSLDKCWADWASVSTPPLNGNLFSSAIEAAKRLVSSRLSKPVEGPILIKADSTEEALAFLSQLLSRSGGEELALYRDRVLVFDEPSVLPRLAEGAQSFIPVAFTREVERELAPYAKSMHSFVIYPRNASITNPDIVLEPSNYEAFTKALEEMGKSRDEASRLADDSGRSLTVLRRQLSTVHAMRTPEWAADNQTAAKLVPFLLVGAWNIQNETDKIGLSLLAEGRSYDNLEKECQNLAQLNDAPIWSVGKFRGVISKIDLLHAIVGAVTPEDLDRYFTMARMVLGEDDPALDLAEDQRWAASVHGKTREFSSVFREGISETLVLLAVRGEQLFKSRLGIDTELIVASVVRDLLPTPLTTRVLEANDHDLPTYAEAAPDEFLSIIERDLKSDAPAVLGLLQPVSSAVFGSSPKRTGLLWALEGLSWSPATLPRATYILARLAQVEINDNWSNKPINSLASIFRAWMPQTAASHDQRVDLMKGLAQRFPDIAWKICIRQFGNHHQIGDYSHKPRWRPDGYGFGEPFPTLEPIIAFVHEMVEMALTWKEHSLEMFSDLVERLHDLNDEDQNRVWALIENWAKTKASDADKANMREKIRVSTLSQRAARRAKMSGKTTGLATAGEVAYAALEPVDLLNKYAWMFRDGWVDESADEIWGGDEVDFNQREERNNSLRADALREILKHRGLAGILELSERGNASWAIGALMASSVLSEQELQSFLLLALEPILAGKEATHSYKNLISGAIRAVVNNEKREAMFKSITASLPEEETLQLFTLAPFGKSTWKWVDTLSVAAQTKYWSAITPDWLRDNEAENNEAIERLLKAKRPRAAFSCVKYHPEKIDAQLLFRLLSEMAQGGNDQTDQYPLEHYHVEKAFNHLSGISVLTLDQMAGLEFAYIDALARPWSRRESYGIPNLERYVEAHPELFVQAVTWAYTRNDGAADPVEFQVPPEHIKTRAERGYKLLEAIERIPGHNELEELKVEYLDQWVTTVRNSCAKLGRADIADSCIGKLLSHASAGEDGVWPCEPVRDVIEDIQSESMMGGAHTGVYNSRGVHWRGEGGNQERELAEKYRKWGQALQVSHPFVASKLLMALAKTYDHEASHHDTEAGIRRRLR